jgi:hypothetical protein
MAAAEETPKKAFLPHMNKPMVDRSRPDLTAVAELRSIADRWIAQGQYFSAGYALYQAIEFAWGDMDAISTCFFGALDAFADGAESTVKLSRLACLRFALIEFLYAVKRG